MKAGGLPHWYISGPHSSDYYLLQDEQSDHIFASRLAEHSREASGSTRGEGANSATAGLVEMWIDETDKRVWYLFEARDGDKP
jgi:DNA-binding ferritin-like protein